MNSPQCSKALLDGLSSVGTVRTRVSGADYADLIGIVLLGNAPNNPLSQRHSCYRAPAWGGGNAGTSQGRVLPIVGTELDRLGRGQRSELRAALHDVSGLQTRYQALLARWGRCARFQGKVLSREPHAFCWAGVIQRKLTFAKKLEGSRFQAKKPDRSPSPDNSYEPLNDELRWISNTTHDIDAHQTDTGGVHVLAIEPARQFGAGGPILSRPVRVADADSHKPNSLSGSRSRKPMWRGSRPISAALTSPSSSTSRERSESIQ
jgi:hypothetical protein